MPQIVRLFDKKSDEELLALVQEDSREAFSAIYDRYWDSLIKKALFKLGNQADAEEVVQNVFVSLWRARQNIHIRETFRQYLFIMLRNEIFHYLTDKLKKNTHIQIDEIGEAVTQSQETGLSRLELKELQQEVNSVVDLLPEKCQLIFRMSRDEGLSARQIAEQLDISHRTVETQLSKAIKTIKMAMKRFVIIFFLC